MYLKNEKGMALLITLLAMTVLIILGTGFIFAMTTEGTQSIAHDQKVQAYYYARSGAEAALAWVELETFLDPSEYDGTAYLAGDLTGLTSSKTPISGDYPIMTSLRKSSDQDALLIESVGTEAGHTQQVSLSIQIQAGESTLPDFDVALFAAGEGTEAAPAIRLSGSAKILGPAGTNTTGIHSIQFDWSNTVDQLLIAPGETMGDLIKTAHRVSNEDAPEPDPSLDPWTQVEAPWINVPQGAVNMSSTRVYGVPAFPSFPESLPNEGRFVTNPGDIKGAVRTPDGQGVGDVTLYIYPAKEGSFPKSSTLTTHNPGWTAGHGTWALNSQNGAVVIKPVKAGYRFEPASIEITGPQSNVNFLAIPDSTVAEQPEPIDSGQSWFWKIDQDGYYDTIEVNSNRTLVVDLKGGTRILRVKQFIVSGQVQLMNVGENGKLLLYVEESFVPTGNSDLNYTGGESTDPNTFNVFIQAGHSLSSQQFKFLGNLFLENGTATIGQGTKFTGNLISGGGNIEISGGGVVSNGIIYAPASKVSVLGGAQVTGSIVANSLEASGGTTITYDSNVQNTFPMALIEGEGGSPGGGTGTPTLKQDTLLWH